MSSVVAPQIEAPAPPDAVAEPEVARRGRLRSAAARLLPELDHRYPTSGGCRGGRAAA